MDNQPLKLIIPVPPLLPDPPPPVIDITYNYEQLKHYRLQSQPHAVRATYDIVQWMIEDGIQERLIAQYIDWLSWVRRNL